MTWSICRFNWFLTVPNAVLPHAVRPDVCRVVQRVLPIVGTMWSSLMAVAS